MSLGCSWDAVGMGYRPTQSCMICSKLHLWIAADLEWCGIKLTTNLSAVHLQGSAGPHNVMYIKYGLVKSAAQTAYEA